MEEKIYIIEYHCGGYEDMRDAGLQLYLSYPTWENGHKIGVGYEWHGRYKPIYILQDRYEVIGSSILYLCSASRKSDLIDIDKYEFYPKQFPSENEKYYEV